VVFVADMVPVIWLTHGMDYRQRNHCAAKETRKSGVGCLRNLVIPFASFPDLFSSVCAECSATNAALFSLDLFPGPNIFLHRTSS
jgi:hypothetical protein